MLACSETLSIELNEPPSPLAQLLIEINQIGTLNLYAKLWHPRIHRNDKTSDKTSDKASDKASDKTSDKTKIPNSQNFYVLETKYIINY